MSGYEGEPDLDEFDYESDFEPDGGGEVEWIGPVEYAALEVAEEASRQVDPSAYEPLQDLSPEAAQLTADAQWQAAQQVAREGYEQGLLERVAELGAEYDISSQQALRQVASEVDAAKQQLFRSFLAEGFDVQQAGAAMDDADLDGAIRAGLEQQRYLKATNHGSLAQWRAGRESAARKAALAGEPPPSDEHIFGPTWQRQYRAAMGYAEREAQRQAVWKRFYENQGWK